MWNRESDQFEEIAFSFSELSRPIDILPSGDCIRVLFDKIISSACHLEIPFESSRDERENEFVSSDTRFMRKFRAKFFVCCDDKNAAKGFTLEFDPNSDQEWSAGFLEDYDSLEFRRSIVMPKRPISASA